MNKIIIFTAILGCAAAAPGLYLTHDHETHIHTHTVPVVHTVSSPSKTTITKTSNEVNHGRHEVVHVPVHYNVHYNHEPVHYVHESVHSVHEPTHALVHAPVHVEHKHVEPAKSSQYFKLENTEYKTHKVITPVVHKVVTPVVSVAPVVHAVHTPVVHAVHTPVVAHLTRSGDSAVSHHSSTVHETVHEVKHVPLYTTQYHH